jgi:UDP-N-acetylmuramoyl-tripeptide--D-alanyl-D-alanine ligase
MERIAFGQLVGEIKGKLSGDPGAIIKGVSIDSRVIKEGEVFVALKGTKLDGHDFIEDAIKRGAKAVVTSREVFTKVATFLTDDTLKTLGEMAKNYRKGFDIPIVAITGSFGKTTTKDFTASILKRRYKVLKTKGNYNTEIGIPLTLFELGSWHEIAVIEIGVYEIGEIREMAEIIRPKIGVITGVGKAHIGKVGSMDNICKALGELVEFLGEDDIAILNADDPLTMRMSGITKASVLTYGTKKKAHVKARDISFDKDKMRFTLCFGGEEDEVTIPIPGFHSVQNALGGAAVAFALGFEMEEVKEGLEAAGAGKELTPQRMEVKTIDGITILDDTYNSSPESVRAALETLTNLKGRKIAVLGGMLELGDWEVEEHLRIGRVAARMVDHLFTLGELGELIAQGATIKVGACRDKKELLLKLKDFVKEGDVILFKASRGIALEEVVEEFIRWKRK